MILSRPETGGVLRQELPGPALLQGLPPQPGHGPPRAGQVKLRSLCNLMKPSAAKLVGLWVVQKSQTSSMPSFACTCRTQTYSSSEESYTSTARREGTREGTLASDSGEAGGQPKEVASRWAGVEDKSLSEIWEQSTCPPPAMLYLAPDIPWRLLQWGFNVGDLSICWAVTPPGAGLYAQPRSRTEIQA